MIAQWGYHFQQEENPSLTTLASETNLFIMHVLFVFFWRPIAPFSFFFFSSYLVKIIRSSTIISPAQMASKFRRRERTRNKKKKHIYIYQIMSYSFYRVHLYIKSKQNSRILTIFYVLNDFQGSLTKNEICFDKISPKLSYVNFIARMLVLLVRRTSEELYI